MLRRAIIILVLLPLFSCGVGSGFFTGSIDPYAKGTNYATAEMSLEEAYDNFRIELEDNEGISIMTELNHSTNAEAAGMELQDSRIIFFGNPEMGTQIMQRNQLAGLELPLRVLFYEKDEQVVALFNSASYMERRYGLGGASILDRISSNLDGLVGNALYTEVVWGKSPDLRNSQGIKTVQSTRNFAETYAALQKLIEDNEDLKIVAEVDHSANAANAGMQLRPTRLIMFGNPNLGTPLMQSAISTGLDFPQKMLVWEDEGGNVNISFNTPQFLEFRHGFKGLRTEVETIGTSLNDMAVTAAGL
jgi:uncharacterized protein (DUF302 family)